MDAHTTELVSGKLKNKWDKVAKEYFKICKAVSYYIKKGKSQKVNYSLHCVLQCIDFKHLGNFCIIAITVFQ